MTGKTNMSADKDNTDNQDDTPEHGVAVKTRTKTKKPSMYKVLMLNDDYTPMEFVINVLEQFMEKGGKHVVIIYEPDTEMNLSMETESILKRNFTAIDETGVPLEIMHSLGIRDWLTHYKRKS